MRVGLFVPCYIDQFYPDVAMATVEILEGLGIEVIYPEEQTCCGQPMANTGCIDDTRPLAQRFVDIFGDFDHVVSPSGSCVSMVRNHYESLFHDNARFERMRTHTWELCEFLVDVLGVEKLPARFPHRVSLHSSCHGLRELRLGACTERMGPQDDKVRRLLSQVEGIELVEATRPDECCGFGGTFAVAEEGVSVLMGVDRVADHVAAGAEVMTATDSSCLMHMEGIIRRRGLPIVTMHIAEVLAGRSLPQMGSRSKTPRPASTGK
ncbi:MAG: (Fe-S)-binding protein [Pirellulaceae bacterium]|nr:(Fe-S)-binding protein [Pirellulaceae bacterium]